jgi:Eukaryotic aspartyl protease
MANSVRIPISNVFGGGDYTAQLLIGSEKTPVNLILDTGSSTIAVQTTNYNPIKDTALKATEYAQEILYGTGGWIGPMITSEVAMGIAGSEIALQSAYVAIADDQLPNNFGEADGILGLAYNGLNQAYNMTSFLQQQNVNPPVTSPWPFNIPPNTSAYQKFMSILETLRYDDIPPYFDEIESKGLVANKFAFYTLRSFVNLAKSNPATDKLNQGWFILGGGEEQTDLFSGSFIDVDVLDDLYYNVNLLAVQVGDEDPVAAAPLPTRFKQTAGTNAIVDSGTNTLAVAGDVWKTIFAGLSKVDPKYASLIKKGQTTGVPNGQINLSKWPQINFILQGATKSKVTLTVPSACYWQLDGARKGSAVFAIENGGMPQSILGLPLMNNYYCIFDRSDDAYGIIRFAPIKKPKS